MEPDWNKTDEEAGRLFHRQMEEAKKASAADRDFFQRCTSRETFGDQ